MDSPTPHRQLGSPSARQVLLADLHAALIRADPDALDRLAEELLPFLKRALRKRFRSAAEDLIVDAAEDALLEYAAHPHGLDPHNTHLDWMVLHAARRNLMNLMEAERRRRFREAKYVENGTRMLSRQKSSLSLHPDTRRLILSAAADGREREALKRWLNGDCTTASLAAVLGLSDAGRSEQRKGVKRFKDRIIKRLCRDILKK